MAATATLKSKSRVLRDSEGFQEPWKGVCSSRCYFAESDKKRCKCRCRGQHHGRGKTDSREETAIEDFF
jgi:hypothetical protein